MFCIKTIRFSGLCTEVKTSNLIQIKYSKCHCNCKAFGYYGNSGSLRIIF